MTGRLATDFQELSRFILFSHHYADVFTLISWYEALFFSGEKKKTSGIEQEQQRCVKNLAWSNEH